MSAVKVNGEYRHENAQMGSRYINKLGGSRRLATRSHRDSERDEDRAPSVVGLNALRRMRRYCEDRRAIRQALNNLGDPDLLDRIEGGRVLRTR